MGIPLESLKTVAQIPLSKKPVWKQQPDEPCKWFERFWLYLMQETGKRQIVEAVNIERWEKAQEKGGKFTRVAQVPEDWREASVKYRWTERAKSYDDFRTALLKTAELEEISQVKGLSLQSAELAQRGAIIFQEHMIERLQGMHPEMGEESVLTIAKTLKLSIDSARLAMDMRATALGLQEIASTYGTAQI